MKRFYLKKEKGFEEVAVREEGKLTVVEWRGKQYQVDLQPLDGERFSALVDGKSIMVIARRGKAGWQIVLDHSTLMVPLLTEREKLQQEMMGESKEAVVSGEIRAPMPGLIIKIEVSPGDKVKAGTPLLIMEAMKMENEIRASIPGVVKEILVSEHQAVEKDDLLIRIGSDGSEK